MQNMQPARRINTTSLSVYALAIACIALGPWIAGSASYFSLSKTALEQQELWRLWSGHIVHYSWGHVALSCVGIIALQQIFGEELKRLKWLAAFIAFSPLIAMCWFVALEYPLLPSDNFTEVVGLSGVLHGLFAYAACMAILRDKITALTVLIALSAKIIWEQIAGPSETTANIINTPIAYNQHLYGFAIGLTAGLIELGSNYCRKNSRTANSG